MSEHAENGLEHAPHRAKGIRRAGAISLGKGLFFGVWALATKNLPLAVTSGHDIGDKLAYRDEAHAKESTDPKERARLLRSAANKMLRFTIAAGVAELAIELFSPIGHNDKLGLIGNGASLSLDILGRRLVVADSDHEHDDIGHTHSGLDVEVSAVNFAGNGVAVATGQHWVLYPVALYGIIRTVNAVSKIRKQADFFDPTIKSK